jgi:hypothetical protein
LQLRQFSFSVPPGFSMASGMRGVCCVRPNTALQLTGASLAAARRPRPASAQLAVDVGAAAGRHLGATRAPAAERPIR